MRTNIVLDDALVAEAMRRRWGVTARKTIDVIIATFCISHGHALLHAVPDFEPMREHLGLRTL